MYLNEALLREETERAGLRLEFHETADSTNNLGKCRGAGGAGEGLLIVSRIQTGGKGRLGRSFLSGANGLYMTLLMRPELPVSEALKVTTAAAVCIAEAVEELTGKSAGIKWVNDIYTDSGKVCGILCESALTPGSDRMDYIVCGMGINIETPEGGFPPDLPLAGSLYPEGTAPEGTAERLAAKVAAGLLSAVRDYAAEYRLGGTAVGERLFSSYSRHSVMPGREILVIPQPGQSEEAIPAVCKDLDRDYRLLVEYENGTEEWLESGDVSLRFRSRPDAPKGGNS